jgi:hypothetical protein
MSVPTSQLVTLRQTFRTPSDLHRTEILIGQSGLDPELCASKLVTFPSNIWTTAFLVELLLFILITRRSKDRIHVAAVLLLYAISLC